MPPATPADEREKKMYPPELTKPMAAELTSAGIAELKNADDVDAALARPGTTLVVINSVCGCAAGNARPGVKLALQSEVIPDRTVTVFAGVDSEAVNRARARAADFKPSSPSFLLFENGEVRYAMHRHEIEGRTPQDVAFRLVQAFEEHCSKKEA